MDGGFYFCFHSKVRLLNLNNVFSLCKPGKLPVNNFLRAQWVLVQ